jgi:hypothetical protein
MAFMLRIAFALLNSALALFPARYRREYGEERAWVLGMAWEESAARGLLPLLGFCAREWRDLPASLLREYSKEWKLRADSIWDQLENHQESGLALGTGIFPFVLLGVMVLSFEVPYQWGNQNLFRSLSMILMLGGYLLILIGLLLGALAGFPPWALPYLVYAIVFALYIANASTPGLVVFNVEMWGREVWGFRACVPLGIVVLLVARLNRHPWELVNKLWHGIAKDWSRLTFGLYGILPLLVWINFDEMDNTYSFPGAMLGLVLILCGAVFYLRLKSPFWRTFSMILCASLGILAVMTTAHLYWETHSVNLATGESRLLEGPIPYASILAKAVRGTTNTTIFLLLPGIVKLLGLIRHFGPKLLSRSG